MMQLSSVLFLLVGCAFARTVQHETAKNPVGKVITLLERLKNEIAKEGQEEAKAYDKVACFCKEQADDKLYAITKSKEKIEMLVAEIKELAAQIEELDEAVKEDKAKKKKMVAEGEAKEKEREEARKKYEEEEADLASALDAIKEAIEVLQKSKEGMTDAKLSMVAHKTQNVVASSSTTTTTTTTITTTTTTTTTTITKTTTDTARIVSINNATNQSLASMTTSASKSEKEGELAAAKREIDSLKAQLANAQKKKGSSAVQVVLSLLSDFEPGKPHAYEYGSNDIIETLQTLFKQFRDNKYTLDNEETKEKQAYEMEKGARDMQIKFLTELIEKNMEMSAKKSEKKSDLETDRDDEQKLQDKDQEFMDDLTKLCEEKAKGWDARSSKRSEELTAIAKAMEVLKSGVAPNYGSTTVLIDNSNSPAGSSAQDDEDDVDDLVDEEDVGFLQTRSVKRHRGHKKHGARKAVQKFLTTRSVALKSKSLAMIAEQLRFGADNFAKIRELIKDLIQEIKDHMEAEKEKKKLCDEDLGKAVDKRDEMLAKTEEEANNIDGSEARLVKLKDDIAEAEMQVAEQYKALNEATEIRDEEKTNNAKTLKDAEEGLSAVKQAIKVLKEFYGEFLQVQKAPGGRDGKSLDELAPEAETGEYEGKKDKGTGIIGLLEVIEGDFQRTVDDTTKAEEESESEFEEQKTTIEDDIKELKKDSKDKTEELETEEGDLVGHKEELKDAKQGLADAKEELSKLRPQCVDLGLTFKARQERSKEEIKALEEALKILEEYK